MKNVYLYAASAALIAGLSGTAQAQVSPRYVGSPTTTPRYTTPSYVDTDTDYSNFRGGYGDVRVLNHVRDLQRYETSLRRNIEQLKYNINAGNTAQVRADQANINNDRSMIAAVNQRLDADVRFASPQIRRDVATVRGGQLVVTGGYNQLRNQMSNLNYPGMATSNRLISRAWENLTRAEQILQRNVLSGQGSGYSGYSPDEYDNRGSGSAYTTPRTVGLAVNPGAARQAIMRHH
jgi:hypothetical protein